MSRYYHICRNNIGCGVAIRMRDGRSYQGVIRNVTPNSVHLIPFGRQVSTEDEQQTVGVTVIGSRVPEQGSEVFFGGGIIVPLAAIIGLTIVGTSPFWGRRYRRPYRRTFYGGSYYGSF